jgi:hypothetical protein
MDGKLKALGWLNAIAPGVLVHMVDQFSGRRFLVDTGAAFSIIPHSSSLPASGRGIVGPTGLPIKCWGEREVQLKLSGQCFKWIFLQAEVQMAILGIDFLRAFKLSVDPAAGRLVQSGTGLILSTISLSSGPTASAIVSSSDPGSLGQVATSAKEVFGTPLIFNNSSVPVSEDFSKQVSKTMGAAEHFSTRYNKSVPQPDGQAVSSPSAGPGPDGQVVSSPSAVPGHDGQAVSSSSSTVTGCLLRVANGGRLASRLPTFFQLLLQRYQDVVNPSKALPVSSHGVVHYLRTTGPPIASPFHRLDADAKADFMKMEAEGIIQSVQQSVGISSSFGQEAGRVLAAVRQFPPSQQRDCAEYLSSSQHDGFFC